MEEKERYEIHRYTLQANEKISFNDYTEHICEHYDFNFEKIKPFTTRIQDLLNQQDKRIKELEEELDDAKRDYIPKLEFGLQRANKMGRDAEEENQQLKEKLNNFETCMEKYNVEDIEHLDLMLFVLSGETKYHLKEIKDKHKKELKQSQKQLAIAKLEKVKENIKKVPITDFDLSGNFEKMYKQDAIRQIDNQIKQLKKR